MAPDLETKSGTGPSEGPISSSPIRRPSRSGRGRRGGRGRGRRPPPQRPESHPTLPSEAVVENGGPMAEPAPADKEISQPVAHTQQTSRAPSPPSLQK